MDISNLSKILQAEKKFRFKQAYKALFVEYISSWQELSVFPLDLRERLENQCPLSIDAKIFQSSDKNTKKAVICLNDQSKIETVLIKQKNKRYTVCLSSQVGCPLACSFCASGSSGFKRNLSRDEIIESFIFWARYLKEKKEKISNLVFMGSGEPLLNYHSVLSAIKLLNDEEAFNFGSRRISLSTVGLSKEIRRLAQEPYQINLAISLQAPNDDLREKLMPKAVKINSLREIFKAVDYYIEKTNRRVMFEYTMIKDINDSQALAKELITLMRKPLYLLNLIPYNDTETYKASSFDTIDKFKEVLRAKGVRVTIRQSLGSDISAACGQLLKNNN
jgi:23S rRNA (adenine2503-C2)-methyltransferase